ncbi:hypothetical protein BN194_P0460 (plasmid) [Lacticaseibacillus paracasei]|nr:hypothetical protein BN194_P0460 [Lacticaseibacillus paracasei]
MPFFVIKKGLVLLEWKYFPTPKILDPIITISISKIVVYLTCVTYSLNLSSCD